MPKIEIYWPEYKEAAIQKLKERYPMIDETEEEEFLTEEDMRGDQPCYNLPHKVKITII